MVQYFQRNVGDTLATLWVVVQSYAKVCLHSPAFLIFPICFSQSLPYHLYSFPPTLQTKFQKFVSSFKKLPITFFLLSSHVADHLPILLKFSQSALPFYFVSFFSCFESYYHPLFFFSCEFTVVFWNLKQLFEFLNFNYTCFHLLIKIMCLFLLFQLVFLLLSSKSFFYITTFIIIINAEI